MVAIDPFRSLPYTSAMRPWLILTLPILLAACAASSTRLDNGAYLLRYDYGAVDAATVARNALDEEAARLCPNGWIPLRERRRDEGFGGWERRIRCVDPNAPSASAGTGAPSAP
jgi:hypothetical protein